MTITKKVLSLVLVLTMLLTMATFPAFADDTYTPKTVEFVKTASYPKIDQHKSNVSFTLPQVDVYVGDTIKFPDTFFADNQFTYGDTAVSGVSVAIRNCATQNKAMIYSWGKDSDPTYKASYTFTEAGFYMLTSDCFYKIDGTNPAKYFGYDGDLRWGVIEVKPVSEYSIVVTKPTTTQTSGDSAELASATLDYLPFNGKDATVQSASILGTDKYSVGQNTAGSAAPAGTVLGLTFELEEESFVEEITFTATNDNMFSTADIYGSLDGGDWYLIADDQQISPNGTSSAWELTTFTATVDAVAKYVKIKNFTYKGATYLTDISGATVEGYVLQGSLAPTTCEVTFIDKTSLNPQDDVIVTVDIGSTVTVPTEFATGYKFYSDSACTTEIDITTATFSQRTTVYVKTETFNFPTYQSNDVPKIVMLVQGPGNVAVLPDGVTVNVGDTLLVPIGKPMNNANLKLDPWSTYHVSRLSSEDGSVDKNYYHTDPSKGTNAIPKKAAGSNNSGIISIKEPGVYTVMQNNVAISEEILVDTYANGTYVTEAPTPDKAYAAQTHELYYDETTTMFTLPAGAVVRVGDTLKFSTTLPIHDYANPYPLVTTRQTIVSFDVNGNGYIDEDEVAAIDSKGSDELDTLLKKGEVLITKTGVYAFATIGGSIASTWLAPITVNEYALDPALIEGSNEIIYEESSSLSSAVGMDTTEIVLNLKVKMAKGTVPAFTYSETATSENVTLLTEESTADYDMYLVTAVFAFNADTMDITVTYGDNFRITAADTFNRRKSDKVFSTSLLEGDNVFYVSNLKPKFNATSSSLTYLYFEISTQKFVGGVTEGIINGVEYKDLKIELVDVISKSSRFEPFTLETFCYDPAKEVYNASLGIKAAGFDKFFATVQLTGVNQTTKQYEVIEEKVFSTEMIEIIVKPADTGDNHRVGGSDVPSLLAQLEKVYADKNYVIIDCINDYLVDEDGKFILDENGNKIANLAQKNPADAVLWHVDDVLWNGLINMNKAYFEFRFAAPTNDPIHGRNNIIRNLQCIEYSIRIDKTSHNMIRLNENAIFRCGMRLNGTAVAKALKNSVKEQLGNGYDPLFINVSWWMASVPFTQTTFSITLPEEWTAVNGTEDLKLYRYGNSNGTATLTLDREGLKVDDRYDNRLTFDISGQYFYSSYALVGADNTVERPGDSTAKHNVATGGADLVAAFATFATIALAAYGLKKRED